MQSPQSEWALQLANIEQQLGQNTYDWANQQYGNTSALTDQAIGNYLGNASTAQGMAGQQINQYNQEGVPQIQDLFREANTYASPARIAAAEGAAQSDSMQGSDAARRSEEAQLRSFGADPTSGRYAGLDEAQRMQAAASAVGAGQTAGRATEQTGRDLRTQAVAAAEQLPGEAINSINAGYSGLSGAVNAGHSNVNTGVSALGAANQFMNTASQLKYPPTGAQSSGASTSQQNSGSYGITPAPTGGGSGGGSRGGGSPKSSGGGGGSGNGGGSGGGYGSGAYSPGVYGQRPYGGGSGSGSGGGYGGGLQGGGYPGATYGAPNSAGPGSYGGDINVTTGLDTGAGGGYAGGGAIGDEPTTGGPVPRSASPSGGIQTDDIPARLNAHEFVIPQDVALWKGQEHFHKLIGQSRQARQQIMGQTGAKPSMGPPTKGPPSFVSAHMHGGAI
jgi:hypothetical protein